ncbi:oligosaccharide flippase family protein [Candidatus Woesearchaeota archaeon]|nr:oligosaccharide flippase family protein [Candidatus Woesearchaeota archaeon]
MKGSLPERKQSLVTGTIFVAGAQAAIVLAGYFIHFFLGRRLGPFAYGDFGVLSSLMLINTALFLTGINRAVAKQIAEGNNPSAVMKAGFQLQAALAALGLLFYFFFAPKLASLLQESSLSLLIIFSSLAIFTQGMHTIYAKGYLNGLHNFRRQAFMEGGVAVLKVILAIAFVTIGWGVFGAVAAYVLAPLLVIFFVFPVLAEKVKSVSKKSLLQFALPITLSLGLFVAAMELGLLAVKSILSDDLSLGIYTAATTVPKIIYSLSTAFSLTILPAVAGAVAQKKEVLMKKYIQQALRYSMLLLVPFAVLISVSAPRLIVLLYSTPYQSAGPLLEILAFSALFFSLFLTLNTILFAVGKRLAAILLSTFLLAIGFIGYRLLIPAFSLQGAAWWAVGMGLMGVLASGLCLRSISSLPLFSLGRICLAGAIILWLGRLAQLQAGFLLILPFLLILYVLLLFALGEITPEDRSRVKDFWKRFSKFWGSSSIKF